MKKFLILIFAILIITSVGLIIPILMNRQPGDIVDDISKVSDALKKDDKTNADELGDQGDSNFKDNEGINKNIIDDKLSTPDITKNPRATFNNKNANGNENDSSKAITQTEEKDKKTEDSQNENKDGDKETDNDKKNDSQNQNSTPEIKDSESNETPTKNETKSWIDEKLDEYKDDIDPADIPDIKRIYSKIDVAYVQSLSEDGMTDEAKNKIKEYLKKTLGSDYDRAKELFYMYSYLI
ncbi:MAG TPA: hypothetical protein PK566_09030 [Pseudobacteroides sp.]|nr:hypothetical protein [Pseudobacteroides sp.]